MHYGSALQTRWLIYYCSCPEQIDETTITVELSVKSKETDESFTVEFGHSLDVGRIKKPIILMRRYDDSRIILHSKSFNWSKKKKMSRGALLAENECAAALAEIAAELVAGRGGASNADSHAIDTGD